MLQELATKIHRFLSPQLVLLVSAVAIWSIRPVPRFWAPVLAYFLAWILLDRLWVRLPPPTKARQNTRSALLVIGAITVAAAAPIADLFRARYAFADNEGLIGLGVHLEDRLRLENTPAIAPPTVFSDHPQTLYIYAPGAGTAALRLAAGLPELPGDDLGHGLFRVSFDPRTDPLPDTDLAILDAALIVDRREHRRTLGWVRPLTHPRWFASAPDQGLAATVSEETDELILLDREGLVARLPVGDGPVDAVFVRGGRQLAVAHRYTPQLWVIDVATREVVARLPTGHMQGRLAASPSGIKVAVAIDEIPPRIEIIDLARELEPGSELGARETLRLDTPADWLAFGPSDELLVVSSRHDRQLRRAERLPTDTDQAWRITGTLTLGRPVVTLGRAPEGATLWLATTDFRPDGEPHRGNHFVQDQLLILDVVRWRIADRRLTARRTPRQDAPGDVSSGLSPMGIVVRGDGSAWIAFAGSEEVWSLSADARTPDAVIAGYDLDLISPVGVADLGDGFWAASTPAGGAAAVYGADNEMVAFVGLTPPDADLAAAAPGTLDRQALTLRAGERAFYEATRAGISCQSCHLHADTDHSPHEIGQDPLLPTLTVRGTRGTAPYLRDASFPRIRDLDSHLAGDLYRGYVRFDEGRGLALETFVGSLPRAVNPRSFGARKPAEEGAGLDAFVQARCNLCHVPPAFTNLSQHPVETLFPSYAEELRPGSQVDTPSLLGSHARSHFLQNGRAHSLSEVLLEHNEANQHGDSRALSGDQRDALSAFLLAL